MYLAETDNNTFIDNNIYNSGDNGILAGNFYYNSFSNNSISLSGQHGIFCDGACSRNTFTSNTIYDYGASYDGFRFDSSDQNVISSNIVRDLSGAGYAINILNSTCDDNIFVGNYYSGTGAATINDVGTGTIYNAQLYGNDLILKSSGNVGIGTTAPASVLEVGGGITFKKITADPCGAGYPEGVQFYNDTGDYFCFCDGAGVDKKVSDNTNCF